MDDEMHYFDTSYLVRLYLDDAGYPLIRELAVASEIASGWHAQAEVMFALQRGWRDGRLNEEQHRTLQEQFQSDRAAGVFHWLPLEESILVRLERVLAVAPAETFLRAADAMHLACAAEEGFSEVYSNDRHLLAAAPLFGLQGVNIIAGPPL